MWEKLCMVMHWNKKKKVAQKIARIEHIISAFSQQNAFSNFCFY